MGIVVATYLWSDPDSKYDPCYGVEDVRRLRDGVKAHLTLPHEFAVITDMADAFEGVADIRVIKPEMDTHVPGTCFRRLFTFHPDGANLIGERVLQLDLDCLIVGNLDGLFDREEDLIMWRNPTRLPYDNPTKPGRCYFNTSCVLHRCGTMPEIWNGFVPGHTYGKDDQWHLSEILGKEWPYFNGADDGIYRIARSDTPGSGVDGELPHNARVVFFTGSEGKMNNPEVLKKNPWIATALDTPPAKPLPKGPETFRFRPHRSTLAAAMQEAVEVNGYEGLIEHLRQTHPEYGPAFNPRSVTIAPYSGADERIGWKNTYLVSIEGWGPVGFCESNHAPDTFLTTLNDSVVLATRMPRVRFEVGIGDEAERWIKKKHTNGAVHEPGTIAAFIAIRKVRDCKNIYDVGALWGYFSILSAMLFDKANITAFEMHPACILALSTNIWPNAKCVHGVMGDECRDNVKIWISGFNIFEEPEGGWENLENIPGAMKPRGESNRGRGFASVDFGTLDAWSNLHGYPDLMKIDVEGYQGKAVLGAARILTDYRPFVIIELHDPEKLERFGITNASTVAPLFSLGYQAYWCGNFRDDDAVFERVYQMDERHEKLSIMVFVPPEKSDIRI